MANKFIPRKRFLKSEALKLVRRGDIDSGIKKYLDYLRLNELDDDAWSGLGGAYRRVDDITRAIESYEKAYQINPESTYALVNIVSLLAARNEETDKVKLKNYLPEALRLTRDNTLKEDADHWAWYDFATVKLIQRDLEGARKSFVYAAELTPKTAIENFRSVINSLETLRKDNPSIQGISEIIGLLRQYVG